MMKATPIFRLTLLFSLLTLGACIAHKKEINSDEARQSMIEADRAFSKLSETKGMRFAFMDYIDSNGVLLRPNTQPMVGANAIDFISQGNDTSYTMTWEPNGANVAQSGELGYTYGMYSIKPRNRDTVFYGTYVSIWKRQPDGKWKFVLDTGNEGIGTPE